MMRPAAKMETRRSVEPPIVLSGEPFEKTHHFAFEMRHRIVGRCAIEVVNVPVFHAVAPRWKFRFHQRPVLGFLDGDDVIGRGQIGFRHR